MKTSKMVGNKASFSTLGGGKIARLVGVVVALLGGNALHAEDYTVSIPAGETWTWAQTEEILGTDTDGKRLIKTGEGVLSPGEDLSAKGFTELRIDEGVYEASALNQLPVVGSVATITIAAGSTLRFGFPMNQTTTTINVTVGGDGAADEGGAVVFTADSGIGAKNGPNWTLTADTVFYAQGERRKLDFSCNAYSPSESHNMFHMNGHALRFKGDASTNNGSEGPFIRFRSGPTFTSPGEIVFDNCRFSRYNAGGTRVWISASNKAAGTIPRIRLVNGASCNFGCTADTHWLANVAEIEAEADTEIGYNGVSVSPFPTSRGSSRSTAWSARQSF
ncbi:MAG: hypothetical protein ACI4Q3_04460 [Kiritimatiellia bacterium]